MSSHLLDVVLVAETVPIKYRRRLINILIPLMKDLLDDKIGSRVAEKVWEAADGYTKEKIARSLLPHAMAIGASQYGRFIHPKLQFHLLERRPDEWRASVINVKHHFAHQKAQPAPSVPATKGTEAGEQEEEGRKRKKDEIDELFEGLEDETKKAKRR
jgi:nucleolar protein 9